MGLRGSTAASLVAGENQAPVRTGYAALQAPVQARVRGPESALEAGRRRGGHQARRHRGAGHRQGFRDVEALQCEQVENQQGVRLPLLWFPVPCVRSAQAFQYMLCRVQAVRVSHPRDPRYRAITVLSYT